MVAVALTRELNNPPQEQRNARCGCDFQGLWDFHLGLIDGLGGVAYFYK